MKKHLFLIMIALCGALSPGYAVETIFETPEGVTSITPADAPVIRSPKMMFPDSQTQGLESWRPNMAKDPSVVWFRDHYWMYFSIFPTSKTPVDCCLAIGVAVSDDLEHWNLAGVVTPLTEADRKGLGAPCAKVWDGKVHLFYQSYGNGAHDAILYATSEDGLNFTPYSQTPIFSPTGSWTNGRAIDADFVEFQGKCFLYAATRDAKGQFQKIVVAVAPDRNHLGPEDWKLAYDGAILEPELSWETRCIEAPSVIERDGKLYMFYAGGYNNNPQHVGVAQSEDGIRWVRLWDIPFVTNGPAGQWNSSESGHPGIFQDPDGQTFLFFQGNATRGNTWFLTCVPIRWTDGGPSVGQ